MFINGSGGYNRHGEQTARGDFLVIFAKGQELRAAVRHVRMSQLGHWMMASVKIGPYKTTLSGSYGSDGLPKNTTKSVPRTCWHLSGITNNEEYYWYERTYEWEDVPVVNWEKLVPLPADLTQEFWHPEHQGWNSAGSEAKNIRNWAKQNIRVLKNAGK